MKNQIVSLCLSVFYVLYITEFEKAGGFMGIVRSDRHTEADGEITVNRGADASEPWSEITVSVFDASGNPANPSGVTGTLSGKALKSGSGKPQNFRESIDLSSHDWSWQPELSRVQEFLFSVSGLNANHTYQITISSWGIQ